MLPSRLLALLSVLLLNALSYGQVKKPVFSLSSSIPDLPDSALSINCRECPVYHVNDGELYSYLQKAPHIDRVTNISAQGLALRIPNSKGEEIEYRIAKYDMVEAELYTQFPDLMTFVGKGLDGSTIRADYTSLGFRAWILGEKIDFMIEPLVFNDKNQRIIKDNLLIKDATDIQKIDLGKQKQSNSKFPPSIPNTFTESRASGTGSTIKRYRLAASTDVYYVFNNGSTLGSAFSSLVSKINRVNLLYERDLAINFVLVTNTPKIIFHSSNPANNLWGYFNYNYPEFNQFITDSLIGSGNYDVGLMLVGNNFLSLTYETGSVCTPASKAKAHISLIGQLDEYQHVIQIARTIAHQFGATNTHNSSYNPHCVFDRDSLNAFEIGGGSTILSAFYGCSLSSFTSFLDPYFHFTSIKQIRDFVQNGNGSLCGTNLAVSNHKPIAIANDTVYTPPLTPFVLTGLGNDPDLTDTLTYCWEQYDLGPPSLFNTPLTPNSPRFRSFPPTTEPSRTFPSLKNILNNADANSEYIPDQPTTLTFKLTVRDNAPYAGAIDTATTIVKVTNNGPFKVNYPNIETDLWNAGSRHIVQWSVANTDLSPFECLFVKILLSVDGGVTWPYVLSPMTDNDGIDTILVPLVNTTNKCRVMIRGIDQIFFDISDQDFKIRKASFPHYSIIPPDDTVYTCTGDSLRVPIATMSIMNYNSPLYAALYQSTPGLVITLENDTLAPGDTLFVWLKFNQIYLIFSYRISIKLNSAAGDHITSFVVKNITNTPLIPGQIYDSPPSGYFRRPILAWDPINDAEYYDIEIINPITNITIAEYQKVKETYKHLDFEIPIISETFYNARYRGANSCAIGPWSDLGKLSYVRNTNCFTINNDTVKTLSDIGHIDYYFEVPNNYFSANIINLKGHHYKFDDLRFKLESFHDNLELFNYFSPCFFDSSNFHVSFLNHASDRVIPCKINDSAVIKIVDNIRLRPEYQCSPLRFTISDNVPGSSGMVSGMQLEVCYLPCSTPSIRPKEIISPPVACEGELTEIKCVIDSIDLNNKMSYRWLKNGVPISDKINYVFNIREFDTVSLVLSETNMSDAGDYQLEQLGCCDYFLSDEVTLEILPRPEKPILNRVGDSIFTSSPFDNLWYINDSSIFGNNGQSVYISDTGTYSVIHFQNGCNSLKSSLRITALRIGEGILSDYQIYPNPFNDEIHLEYTGAYDSLTQGEPITFNMIDYLGRSVFQTELTQNHQKHSIRIPDLSSGLYFIILQNAGKRKVFKLLKRKN